MWKRIFFSVSRVLIIGLFYFLVGYFVCYFVILKTTSLSDYEVFGISLRAGLFGGILLSLIALCQEIKAWVDFSRKKLFSKEEEKKEVEIIVKQTGRRKVKKKSDNPSPPDDPDGILGSLTIF